MTVGTPSWIAASAGAPAYDATELRLIDTVDLMWDGHNLGARAGVRPGGNALAVSLGGSPLSWTVQPGIGVVSGLGLGALGAYRVPVLAAISGTVPARDATWDRKDIVVLRVKDPEADGGALREGAVEYLTGTPAPTPSAPPTPALSLLLATVTVPKVGGPAESVASNLVYTVASGGILPTPARPSSAYPGQIIYRLDNGDREVYNGSGWISEPGLRPAARLKQTSAQTFTHATFADLTFQSATFNVGGLADLANHRLVAPRAGVYSVSGRVAFSGSSTSGYRRVDLKINGALYTVGETKDANAAFAVATTIDFTEDVLLAAGDIIKIQAIQTSGGNLATVAATDFYSSMSAVFIGPGAAS